MKLTPSSMADVEHVRAQYLHSAICLHGVVLNELSTGTTLFLTYFLIMKKIKGGL
jgi:hypothetical protein